MPLKIKGNKVVVKTMPEGTKFTTLDDVERTLHEEDLMICDESGPNVHCRCVWRKNIGCNRKYIFNFPLKAHTLILCL
jgi:phenylalanyl-tRNA synthetase beta chain